jgi:hypothetical protein
MPKAESQRKSESPLFPIGNHRRQTPATVLGTGSISAVVARGSIWLDLDLASVPDFAIRLSDLG